MTRTTSLAPPLGTGSARVLLLAFALVHVLLAVGPSPTAPVWTVTALIATITAAALVVLTSGPALSLGRTAAVVALTAGATAVIVPWLPANGWPGYASWPLGAGTFVAIGLTLRGRVGSAWALLGTMLALCLAWAVRGDTAPIAGVNLIDRHLGVLLLGTLFAIGLRRTARAHDTLVAVQQAEALELGRAEAELAARTEAVGRVMAAAGPILERIAAGERFDDTERLRVAAVEGRLRDELALAPIRTEQLDQALDAARRRGVDVVVLTAPTVEDLPPTVRRRAAVWMAAQLDLAHGAEFVGRVIARGRDVRVSATVGERIVDRIIADVDE